MWSSFREKAERRLTEVSENAHRMASRANDVLREAQVDGDDDFGGEEYGFVIGEDAERDEIVREYKRRIEDFEREVQRHTEEEKVLKQREQEAREELSKEMEMRSAADEELAFYRHEKETLQRRLVEMESDKAELAEQFADIIRSKDRELSK